MQRKHQNEVNDLLREHLKRKLCPAIELLRNALSCELATGKLANKLVQIEFITTQPETTMQLRNYDDIFIQIQLEQQSSKSLSWLTS